MNLQNLDTIQLLCLKADAENMLARLRPRDDLAELRDIWRDIVRTVNRLLGFRSPNGTGGTDPQSVADRRYHGIGGIR